MSPTKSPRSQRHYVPQEVHERMIKYANNNRLGIQKAYENIIVSTINPDGTIKDRLVLTEAQEGIVREIAEEMEQTPEKTVQDLINYAILIYGTNITMRDVLTGAAPVMMDELVRVHPGIAKEILRGLGTIKP
jgi:hypothetical protein